MLPPPPPPSSAASWGPPKPEAVMNQAAAIASDFEVPFPPMVRSSTVPASLSSHHRKDPSHLSPADATSPASRRFLPPPPGLSRDKNNTNHSNNDVSGGDDQVRGGLCTRRPRHRKDGSSRSRSRRRKRFQKLLWVKQSYPDNYTDQATFLENLQRNPRVQPYDFWPLVADSTIIVQHVCSVIIFIVCFVGIFQERVSPVSIVGWGSFATFLAWLVWDRWVGQDAPSSSAWPPADRFPAAAAISRSRSMEGMRNRAGAGGGGCQGPLSIRRHDSGASTPGMPMTADAGATGLSSASCFPSVASSTTYLDQLQQQQQHQHQQQQQQQQQQPQQPQQLLHAQRPSLPGRCHAYSASASSVHSTASLEPRQYRAMGPPSRSRTDLRISTIKSAVLIYFTVLGLSPILKSLTRSTSSDSIWAISFWLLAINIFFYDYSGGAESASGAHPDGSDGGSGGGGRESGDGGVLRPIGSSGAAAAAAAAPVSFPPVTTTTTTTTTVPPSPPPPSRGFSASKFPVASLSTNAALMASTVLASRLPSTGQVFSLTLFSIEVFGLFPLFRRHARRRSWNYHVALTVLLVLGAGGGVGMVLSGRGGNAGSSRASGAGGGGWPLWGGLVGMLVGCLIAILAMGGCAWWLISLQKYKNEIYGPWDPARPIIISRMHWDGD